MIIGIPKEIKDDENRVSLSPSGALEFSKAGHTVIIQRGAGEGSGFTDDAYKSFGAEIRESIEEVYKEADMIMKVKEPIGMEYNLIREGQIVFTFFHFASSETLTQAMLDSGSICVAYETIQNPDGSLPLLIPMSEIAGRMAVQEGAKYLEKPMGGKGILLGGVPGVNPGRVLILGGGIVGTGAAKIAAGLGAEVTIIDINLYRLRHLENILPANVNTVFSSELNIRKLLPLQDLIVGAILVPGAPADKLITRDMLSDMQPGTVLVDVAIDQGGCMETSEPTTHHDPIFFVDGILHYCVTNMPGAVPQTSTRALTNATLPYALLIANVGLRQACRDRKGLIPGINIANGKTYHPALSKAFDIPLTDVQSML